MNPIRDLETLNAIREAGLAKAPAVSPAHRRRHGHLRRRQRSGERLTMLSPKRSTSAGSTCSWCKRAVLASARKSRWSMCGVPGQPLLILHRVQQDHVDKILDGLGRNSIPDSMILCKIERWDHITGELEYGSGYSSIFPLGTPSPSIAGQKKVVLRNCGFINPSDIEEYYRRRRLSRVVRRACREMRRSPSTSASRRRG